MEGHPRAHRRRQPLGGRLRIDRETEVSERLYSSRRHPGSGRARRGDGLAPGNGVRFSVEFRRRPMNRRQLLTSIAALPAASQLHGQSEPKFHLRAGLVAYSYRKQFESKSMNYVGLIERIADWGLDGLDCTVYWFPDTSNEYLASLRKAAYKNGVQIYNAGVRVRLAQPTPELRAAEFENIKKWVDVADRIGASHVRVFGGPIPKGATEQQAIAWSVEVLKRGAEYAGSRGIILGVEDDGGLTIAA